MINKFSPSTIKELGYYVYMYSDPETKKPFYIGKGCGNRVFAHLDSMADTKKVKRIKAIRRKGKEPIIEILAHGLDEETALIVESAAIDMVGIDNLTYQQRGYESRLFGRTEVSLLEARYSREELSEDDILDDIILIRINNTYEQGMSELELYEATRGYWVLNPDHASKAKYAMPVYDGVILEVYAITSWLPSGSTMMSTRQTRKLKGRYEFVGKLAPNKVREWYINKSVATYFSVGNHNPIKYEGEAFWK